MKTALLLLGALAPALASEKPQICCAAPAPSRVIASAHPDKAPAKQPAPAPSDPAKKAAPKERDRRPNPPGHLFM